MYETTFPKGSSEADSMKLNLLTIEGGVGRKGRRRVVIILENFYSYCNFNMGNLIQNKFTRKLISQLN